MNTGTTSASTADPHLQLSTIVSLLSALNAITRWRPLAMLLLTFVVYLILTTVVVGTVGAMAGRSTGLAMLFGSVGFLLLAANAIVGINATGILLSDDVWGRTQRSLQSALLLSLYISLRLVLVLLLLLTMLVLGVMLLAILIYLTKLPGVGPLLYAFIYPLGSILIGVLLFAVVLMGLPIAAPAIWQGASVGHALATIKAVAHYRLVPVLVMMLLLFLLLSLTGGVIFMIVFTGAALTLGLSAEILEIRLHLMGALGGVLFGYGMGRAGDYLWALGFGSGLLLMIVMIPLLLVGIKGLAIIHRNCTVGLDLEQSKAEIGRFSDELKRRAGEARAQAKAQLAATQAAAQAAAAAQTPDHAPAHPHPPAQQRLSPGSAAPAAAQGAVCPSCTQTIADADIFCGNCGYKLR